MKTYHFSCRFRDSDWNYHGVFITSFVDTSEIVKRAKVAVSGKLPDWHKQAKDMTKFEVYHFDENGKEINIFTYES